MTAFQVMPPLPDDDLAALTADITERGIVVPVVVDQHGRILDGHHRAQIATDLGIKFPTEIREVADDAEALSIAFALNVHRRHLTREQRREMLAASIKAAPDKSDREHARITGTSPTTAGGVRDELEQAGQLSKLDSRRGADGRTRPASQPKRPTEVQSCRLCGAAFADPVWHCQRCGDHWPVGHVCDTCAVHTEGVDTDTGEMVDPAPAASTEPEPAKWQPPPPSPEAKAEQARQTSREAWSRNLASHANFFARLAVAEENTIQQQVRDFLPEHAGPFEQVNPTVLRDAARYLTALADAWQQERAA